MTDTLKPCPGCGGQPKLRGVRDGRRVACRCGWASPAEYFGPLDQPSADDRAIAAWNTRTPPPVPEEVVEAYREAKRIWEDTSPTTNYSAHSGTAMMSIRQVCIAYSGPEGVAALEREAV